MTVFRYLCLLTAVANMGGNVLLLALQRPLFDALGIPHPVDMRGFVLESALSFTMGVVALLIFLRPERAIGLLQIGILGKGSYALITYYFFAAHGAHPLYLIFAAWDVAYTVIFFLFWIHLASPDLRSLATEIRPGNGARTNRAAIVGFSLTGNGRNAIEELQAGLRSSGYEVDLIAVEPAEGVFRFPMSPADFVRIVARAFFRYPAFIQPLRAPHRDYDLVIVESPTWLLGMAAPVEAVFQDPANRWLFEGRDAAVVVVCRGAHQRTKAMMVRWLQKSGANVVTARGYVHAGREPRRLISLWLYLIFRRAGYPRHLAEPRYGLSSKTLTEIRRLGERLADRAHPHEPASRAEEAYV